MNRLTACILCLGLAWLSGCNEPPPSTTSSNGEAVVRPERNLAWLGAKASPVFETVAVVDPERTDETLYPGALEVSAVQADGRLANMGLRVGDVLVGVGEEMLPTKEDPTIDFIRLVEGEVSAEQPELLIRYLRNGKLQTAKGEVELVPLEQGLPLAIDRYREIASRAADYLAAQQGEDGSFAAAVDEPDPRILVSSLCGLAMHSVGSHAAAVDKCVNFVTGQLKDPGTNDPLVAAYALMFLVETAPPLENQAALANCLRVIREGQTETGSWLPGVTSEEEVGEVCDVQGTFATNQILLALGVAERNGLVGDNEPIEKAVGYLKSQAKLRIAADLDRRTKAGLSAGTAAAMLSLNMDRADQVVTRLSKEAFRLAESIPHSRELAVPHTLAAAIISRQSGVGAWIDHHRHAKLLVSQLQQADGSFEPVPNANQDRWEVPFDSDPWRTAHYCLIVQLQDPVLAAFSAEKSHPMLVARDAAGKKQAGNSSGPGGGQMVGGLQLDLDGLDPSSLSPEELREKLMEKLKEQGMDVDGASIQIMSSSDSPPDGQ